MDSLFKHEYYNIIIINSKSYELNRHNFFISFLTVLSNIFFKYLSLSLSIFVNLIFILFLFDEYMTQGKLSVQSLNPLSNHHSALPNS